MRRAFRSEKSGKNIKFLALVLAFFSFMQVASAAPVKLSCTLAKNGANATSNANTERTWVYDATAMTVDGHHVGDKVEIPGGTYNRYFITDSEIGFSTSTGVRHTISRADGHYTAFGANGKVIWTGTCVPLSQ